MVKCFICDEEIEVISFDRYGIRPCLTCQSVITETVKEMNNPKKTFEEVNDIGELPLLDEEFDSQDVEETKDSNVVYDPYFDWD